MKKLKLLTIAMGALLMFTACGEKVEVEDTAVEVKREVKKEVKREVAKDVEKPASTESKPVEEGQKEEMKRESPTEVQKPVSEEKRENRPKIEKPTMYGKVQKIIGNEVTLMLAKMPEPVQLSKDDKQKMSKEEMRQKMKDRTIEFTGETIDIIIPVGVPIEKRGQGGMSQVDLESIGVDSMIQVWVEDEDVVKVRMAR